MKIRTRFALAVVAAAIFTVVGAPAVAQQPSFIVTFTPPGVQLLDGDTFEDGGHVNVRTTTGSYGFHFEGKCVTRTDAECAGVRHELAQYIGRDWFPLQTFIPTLGCVTWVQVSGHNYHYEAPCASPTPSTPPTPTPTPTPTVTPTPEPTPEPTPTPTETPAPTPTPSVTPEPSPTATPTSSPQPTPTEGVGPTPQYTERPTPDVASRHTLADTGGELIVWPVTVAAIILIAAGGALIIRKRARS